MAKGHVTENELFEAFQIRLITDSDDILLDLPQITREDIHMFFAQYDMDRDGFLRYSEFASAFLPEDKYSA